MAQDITKRRKLELSTQHLTQQELLGKDIDINAFKLVVQNAFQTSINIADRITAASVSRTIDGASTLEVHILDDKREFLRSQVFHSKIDVQTEGLWWRLRAFNKQGDDFILTFEEREIALLRGYSKHIAPINRSTITRAEFILRLVKEVKEVSIPYYIPALHDLEPVFNTKGAILYPDQRTRGINTSQTLYITPSAGGNKQKIDAFQASVADTILRAGDSSIGDAIPHKRKYLVCAIMTAIVEAQLTNPPDGDRDSKGAFQQRPSQGWPDTTDIVVQANAFYEHAVKYDSSHANVSYGDLCQAVQNSGHPERYALHRLEAEDIVNAYGAPGGDALGTAASVNTQIAYQSASGGFYFYRGEPPSRKHQQWKPENSWNCIQRLASEVNWRAFFVSGTFYLITEDDLFKSQPRAILSEKLSGVDTIDGDYDVNKKVATLDATVRMGKFLIPPGSVAKLEDMGPMDGRWLISTVDRDLFSPTGNINLKKPQPTLLEPQKGNLQKDLIPLGTNTFGSPGVKTKKPIYTVIANPDAAVAAAKILQFYQEGHYKDSNGKQLEQWRLVADHKGIINQCAGDNPVFVDARIPQTIVFLIEQGWRVGTSAICADHTCLVQGQTNKSAHALGKAVDINYLSPQGFAWYQISDPAAKSMEIDWVQQVMLLLQELNPSQILCNGVAGVEIGAVQACQTNNGKQVDGPIKIVTDHTDHIHAGF